MRPHYKFWPKRLPHAITPPATPLWDNLATSARRYPDKAALVFFGTTLSYRALHDGAERLAAHLQSLGVQRGDLVAHARDRYLHLGREGAHAGTRSRSADRRIALRRCMTSFVPRPK